MFFALWNHIIISSHMSTSYHLYFFIDNLKVINFTHLKLESLEVCFNFNSEALSKMLQLWGPTPHIPSGHVLEDICILFITLDQEAPTWALLCLDGGRCQVNLSSHQWELLTGPGIWWVHDGKWEEWETKKHNLALNKPWSGPASFCPDMYHAISTFRLCLY